MISIQAKTTALSSSGFYLNSITADIFQTMQINNLPIVGQTLSSRRASCH